MIGFSELAKSEADNERTSEYLAIIASSANVISELVNDILDLSRIESGKLELDCDDFDSRSFLHTTFDCLVFNPGKT